MTVYSVFQHHQVRQIHTRRGIINRRLQSKSRVLARWLRNYEKTGEPVIDLKAEAPEDGETVKAEHTLAEVKWLKKHSDSYYYSQSYSCSVWEVGFKSFSYATY